MGWRRFVNELLLISPLLFLACITVQARTRIDSFRPTEYTPSLDQKITAYIEPVRLFEQCKANFATEQNPDALRKVGELWRAGVLSGTLKPLLPEVPGDSTRDGIKGQIRAAADELGGQLQRLARKSIADGNYAQAASDALLSVEVLQSMKYSDLYSVGVLVTRQNSAIALLDDTLEHLTPAQKESLSKRIVTLNETEKPIADLVLAEQRTLSEEEKEVTWTRSYQKRLGLMLSLAKLIDNDRLKHQLADLRLEMKQLGQEDVLDDIPPDFRFAWNARRNGNENWRNIGAKLSLAGGN